MRRRTLTPSQQPPLVSCLEEFVPPQTRRTSFICTQNLFWSFDGTLTRTSFHVTAHGNTSPTTSTAQRQPVISGNRSSLAFAPVLPYHSSTVTLTASIVRAGYRVDPLHRPLRQTNTISSHEVSNLKFASSRSAPHRPFPLARSRPHTRVPVAIKPTIHDRPRFAMLPPATPYIELTEHCTSPCFV
jgi:hypothetical protein